MTTEQIILGIHTQDGLEALMLAASTFEDPGERVQYISEHFIGTRYAEKTLIGDSITPEIFVLNLQQVDCMTFIEYIEALRRSSSFRAFVDNVRRVRYRSGTVDYASRTHFFTDWKEYHAECIEDITDRIGESEAVRVTKRLNEKDDGTCFLEGIPPVEREIAHIPSASVNDRLLELLKPGDYIGIYSHLPGLDVSHTGIAVRRGGSWFLRHASSRDEFRRVVDQDFMEYIRGTPGVIVFRPRNGGISSSVD